MDFDLTTEQKDIQKAALEFAKGEFDQNDALEYDLNQQFPLKIWKMACELGFIGLHFPEKYEGQELGLLENALTVEAFCRKDPGIGMALALSDFGSEMVMSHGSEDQKKLILPYAAQGKGILTTAFLEEDYSLAPFATTAKEGENGYVIDGKKSFVTLGNMAGYMIVACQTGPDDPNAQSLLLVEKEIDGLEISSMGEKVGMRMIPMDVISLKGVRIPKENRLGREGQGSSQLKDFLNVMRIETGAMGVGIAQGGLDRALDYAKKREQFGRAIIRFDAIRNKLADMYMEVELARLIAHKAAWSFDNKKPDNRAILMSKTVAASAAYRVTYDAVQIYGGQGYMTEGHIERFYRDAKALEFFLEPGHIQKDMLADDMAGNPPRR